MSVVIGVLGFTLGFLVGMIVLGLLVYPSLKVAENHKARMARITKVHIFQQPTATPGAWDKVQVFGYDDINEGWISAVFDNGMDYVWPRNFRISSKKVDSLIKQCERMGYKKIGTEYAKRYGIYLDEFSLDGQVFVAQPRNLKHNQQD